MHTLYLILWPNIRIVLDTHMLPLQQTNSVADKKTSRFNSRTYKTIKGLSQEEVQLVWIGYNWCFYVYKASMTAWKREGITSIDGPAENYHLNLQLFDFIELF